MIYFSRTHARSLDLSESFVNIVLDQHQSYLLTHVHASQTSIRALTISRPIRQTTCRDPQSRHFSIYFVSEVPPSHYDSNTNLPRAQNVVALHTNADPPF